MQREVTVKVFSENAEREEFFRGTLKLLLIVSDHQNVLRVVDFFETPKIANVLEHVDGQDLATLLAKSNSTGGREGLKLAIGVAAGLRHLHMNNFYHCNLVSSRIIIRRDSTPVLIDLDFPVAKDITASSDCRDRVDVRAFGAVMWEILSGKEPLLSGDGVGITEQRLNLAIVNQQQHLLSQLSHIDEPLRNVIQQCWRHDQEE